MQTKQYTIRGKENIDINEFDIFVMLIKEILISPISYLVLMVFEVMFCAWWLEIAN